jgi:hypothetical protein
LFLIPLTLGVQGKIMIKTSIFLKKSLTGEHRFVNCSLQDLIERKIHLLFFLFIVGFALFNQSVKAQDTVNGGFSGEVYDMNNVPIANATLTFTNLDTGVPVSTRTDKNGRYVRNALLPGNYSVEISAAGYQIERKEQILLATRTNEVLPAFYLKAENTAALTSTPTTTSTPLPSTAVNQPKLKTDEEGAVILETRRGGAFTEKEVTGLPLGSINIVRSFDELALLVLGVAPPPQAIGNSVGPGVGPGVGTSGQFAVNGLRSRANNFTVDGSDNNDEDIGVRRQGFFTLIPQTIESTQEFQIITLLAPAQYGRNLGAQVNALSKSGGNRFSGSLYGFFNSSQLNARNNFDFVGENTRLPLQGQRLNGTFANVRVGSTTLGPFNQVFVENTSGDKDSLTFLQGGGTLGGRIVRGKMFFFVSMEGQLLNASRESNFAVPTVEQRGFLGRGAEGFFIPELEIQSRPTTIIGDYILGLFPFPNNPEGLYGRNTYTRVLPADARGRIVSGKFDYNFDVRNRKQFLTSRYNYTDDWRDLQNVGGAVFSSIRPLTRTDNFSSFLTGELTDKLSNVLRISWGRTRLRFEEIKYTESYLRPIDRNLTNSEESRFLLSAQGFNNLTTPNQPNVNYVQSSLTAERLFGPIGQVNISGFSPLGVDVFNFPQQRVNNTYQIADTMFSKAGSHNFAFGTDIRRTFLESDLPRNSRMSITSTGAFRGNYSGPLDIPMLLSPIDLLSTGAVTGVFQSLVLPDNDANIRLSFNQFNFFAQDEYRVRPNFTISYGLRYELNTVPKEADRKIEDSFQADLPALVSGLNQFIDGRSSIYDSDKDNFAPRMGFAYAPNRSTVIRGGYGIYYDQILGAVVSQSRNVFPTFSTVNFGGVPVNEAGSFILTTPYNILINGQPLIQPGTLNTLNPALTQQQLINFFADHINRYPTPFGATIPQRRLNSPLSHQYFIGIEQQLWSNNFLSVAYVGTTGRNLLRFTTPNSGRNNIVSINDLNFIGEQPNFLGDNRAPDRSVLNIGPIDQFETTGRSQYHSLQVQLRGRFTQNFQYQVNYAFSNVKDDVSDVFDLAGAYALPQNSLTFAGEYAPANFDIRHRFTYSFEYDLPTLNDRNLFLRYLLGDWQINGIGKFNTGQPFTVNTIYDINQDGNSTDRLNNTQFIEETGSRRQPLRLISNSRASLVSMLAAIGSDGSVPRNNFRSGDILELDLSFNKRFFITERQNIMLRFDVFNFINRANFGIPVRFLEAVNFGQAVETITPGRRIQIALKYNF